MALENKKLKDYTELSGQTEEDYMDTNDNDTIGKTIGIGLALIGGMGLYKSGLISPVFGAMKELGASFSRFSGGDTLTRTKIIRDWTNNMANRPEKSLFNFIGETSEEIVGETTKKDINKLRKKNIRRGLWEDLKKSAKNKEFYNPNTRNIINDTINDIQNLVNQMDTAVKGYDVNDINTLIKEIENANPNMSREDLDELINKRVDAFKAQRERIAQEAKADLGDAHINKDYNGIKDVLDRIDNADLGKSTRKVRKELTEAFINDITLDDDVATRQLKQTNYKTLTLGDIFDYDTKTHKLNLKEGYNEDELLRKYNINIKEGSRTRNNLETLLQDNNFKIIQGEKITSIGGAEDIWKKIVIDPSININKEGHIINYMMGKDTADFFSDSLRRDFKLPVLGFNPIDSVLKITPWDNLIGKEAHGDMSFAFRNAVGAYDPFITGKGTRAGDDINTFLQNKFNTPDEDYGLLFMKGDVYALGNNGTTEFLGSGFRAWDISNAKTNTRPYDLPHQIRNLQQMGGYDLYSNMDDILKELGHDPTKAFDRKMTIEEYEKVHNIKMTNAQKFKYEIGRQLDIGWQEGMLGVESLEGFENSANVDNTFDNIIQRIMKSEAFKTNYFGYGSEEDAINAIRTRMYSETFGKGNSEVLTKNGFKRRGQNIVFTREAITFKDVWNKRNTDEFDKTFKGYFRQYFAGFDKNYNTDEFFTERSGAFYDVFNALDMGFSKIGLGLSLENKKSTSDLVKNLILKRALPAFMLTQIPGMINYFSEPFFTDKEERERGENDNLGKTLMRDIVKPIDIGAHGVKDALGFTKMFKYLKEMIPGSDNFTELPIIYQLGLDQTKEEREEYIEKGYDPVRKNRYWSVSNTPFTGSKIDHWRPNIYRRMQADVKYSDSKYGSRKEYYKNTWYPNLVSPLAPIRHFITDPHHWDEKHSKDRPYPETAPKGENIPLIGPLVSGTIGQIYRHKTHKEYWNEDGTLKAVNPEDEKPSQLLMTGQSNIQPKEDNDLIRTIKRAFVDTETFNKVKTSSDEKYHDAAMQRLSDLFTASDVKDSGSVDDTYADAPLYDNALKSYTVSMDDNNKGVVTRKYPQNLKDFKEKLNQLVEERKGRRQYKKQKRQEQEKQFSKAKEYASSLQTSTLPNRDYNRYDTALDIYRTPSGSINIVDVPENLNLYNVNKEIQHYSLNKIYGTNQRIDLQEYTRPEDTELPKQADNQVKYSIGKEFNDLMNIYGLKGFEIQALITGDANIDATQVDNSSYAYSANRSFWDENLGGLGGELSEISRRFIHKKDNKTEYLNPIRNTMPTWLPGSDYFIDFLHGDPYTKVMNGEERLVGEGYERLNNIDFDFGISASMLSNSRASHIKHFLHQDTNLTYDQEQAIKALKKDKTPDEISQDEYKIQNLNTIEEFISRILDNFRDNDVLLDSKVKFYSKATNINGMVDAVIKDYHSRTGSSLINIRGVNTEEFDRLKSGNDIRNQDYYEMNFDLYALNNTKGRGYVYYYNQDNPDDIYKSRVKFNKKDLRSSVQNLNDARAEIYKGLKTGEISRGDLYPLVEKYKMLADVAPYSQEFKDISAQVSHAHLTESEKKEIKGARERMKAQKEPLRVYDYKFKTANLKSEKVTVKDIIDNNTLIVNEYGKEHAIKFAGVNVSQSNSTLYQPSVKETERTDKNGRKRTKKTGKTMNEAAREEINKFIKPGQQITIQYDADEYNKYKKDSTQSIRAVIRSKGTNLNKRLLDKELATEKENDDSPAGIHARYSKGDIAFGSAMETIMHNAAKLPFIGDKFFQIRSPYEEYRKREVYNKDFKSWNHPIRDFVIPTIDDLSSQNPIAATISGAFIGAMMGKNPYGRAVGALIGGLIPQIGSIVHAAGSTEEREWRPKRRRQQEELNTYIDTLKYVKNIKLYNKYKEIAKKEDNFDVDAYLEKQKEKGEKNKERRKELDNYKRLVKLDFKHRGNYNFKYGKPKYEEKGQNKKQTIRAINRELSEISSDRKVEKLPLNAIKAISYKQASEKTMYAYEPGDDIRNIMAALPKKERQYYSKLVKAPEEEKQKILRIAPEYLRRALQASWGMKVDEKPELQEYFKKHALPNSNWAGWREDTNLEDVKVKMVHRNNLDPGEFNIWTDDKKRADQTKISIPKIHRRNDPIKVQATLNKILGEAGLEDVQISHFKGIGKDKSKFNIKQDSRRDVEQQINNLEVDAS